MAWRATPRPDNPQPIGPRPGKHSSAAQHPTARDPARRSAVTGLAPSRPSGPAARNPEGTPQRSDDHAPYSPAARSPTKATQRPGAPQLGERGPAARLPETPAPSHPRLSGPRPGDLTPALGGTGRLALWERLGLEELEGLEGGEGDLGSDEPEVVEDLVFLADEALAGDVGVAVVVGNADEGAAGHLG